MVVLEELVMPNPRVRNHERLHRHTVFFHAVHEAWICVDDQLVGKSHLSALVSSTIQKKLFAVRPVSIIHWHAIRGVCVKHLFGGDCAYIHRKTVKIELLLSDAG